MKNKIITVLLCFSFWFISPSADAKVKQANFNSTAKDELVKVVKVSRINNTSVKKLQVSHAVNVDLSFLNEDHWLVKYKLLKPNVTYQTGEYDYRYQTDAKGRIKEFKTNSLQKTKRSDRLPHDPNTLDKLPGDHAGHLAADRFGGSPRLDNLVSQASHVNLSSYKQLENTWVKAIESGQQVVVTVQLDYETNARPTAFTVNYSLNGVTNNVYIINQNPK